MEVDNKIHLHSSSSLVFVQIYVLFILISICTYSHLRDCCLVFVGLIQSSPRFAGFSYYHYKCSPTLTIINLNYYLTLMRHYIIYHQDNTRTWSKNHLPSNIVPILKRRWTAPRKNRTFIYGLQIHYITIMLWEQKIGEQ